MTIPWLTLLWALPVLGAIVIIALPATARQAAGSLSRRSMSDGRGAVNGWCIDAQPPLSVSFANIGKSTTHEKCIAFWS